LYLFHLFSKVLFIIIAPQPQPLLLKEKGLLEVSAIVIEKAELLHNSYSASPKIISCNERGVLINTNKLILYPLLINFIHTLFSPFSLRRRAGDEVPEDRRFYPTAKQYP